jgi:chemotaxis family two-component system response regulator Rcp1
MAQHVLLVEDSPGDVRLTSDVLRSANSRVRIHVAREGAEAIAFLRKEGKYVDAPRPDLILLDLNLPGMTGSEVLTQVKADESLKTIPTLILTTSEAERDIVNGYMLKANAYLTKPLRLDAFESLVKSVNDFWLMQVKLPKRPKK